MDRAKILIIDDDHGFRRTLSDILQARGYEYTAAGNGEEALGLLERSAYDVVLIDLGLPDMPGIEILNRIKSDYPATEAIILTGNADLESAIEATNKGAASYLQKPYAIEQLLFHVNRAVEKVRSRDRENRAAEELRKMNEELRALYETSLAIGRNVEIDKLFSDVLRALTSADIYPIEKKGGIFLMENDGLRLVAHVGLSGDRHCACCCIATGGCLCGAAAQSGELIVSRNSSTDARHTVRAADMPSHGHVVVPLKTTKKVWGVLCLYTRADRDVGESLCGSLRDVGGQLGLALERAWLYEDAKESSLHDPLTGLGNRRALTTRIEKAVELSKRCHGGLSVIMLDVDHFKNYNDTFGHAEGDRLLSGLADILRSEIRSEDYLFRYGGEEFLVILSEINLENAREAAERIRRAVESDGRVTISLGLASYCPAAQSSEELIRVADEALYRAKSNGRNRVEWGHASHHIPVEFTDAHRLSF